MGGLRWGGNPSSETRGATYPSQEICRIGTIGIESGFEERLHRGIRNVQGLKTKYDEISKELEGSNLDIAVLMETKEESYRK